jgi:hypothetical protein
MAAVAKGFVGRTSAPAKVDGIVPLCFFFAGNFDLKGSSHLKGPPLIDFEYGLFLLHFPSL